MRAYMKRYRWISLALLFLLAFPVSQAGNRDTYPLPEERGTAGALAALEKLPVYMRLLQTTAHPDDESAGTLTWLSRKVHAQTALFCLTRGEGGQNILGNEKYGALGLVRTGELLEACRYYGTDLYFGKVMDFGFSKTSEETLSKWGHEATLEEMVRFIRRWRPTVIISRFQGIPADGHGHHQAAGILTREAYSAASDPKSFPQQLKEGLEPWQPKKLYISVLGAEFAPGSAGPQGEWTVRVPVGDYDPVLGRSYREIASEGYSMHRSQGDGMAFSLPGRSYEYFKLVNSSVGIKAKEDSFFDAIDTSLVSILDLADNEKASASFLREDLASATQAATDALQSFQVTAPEHSAAAVAKGIEILTGSIRRIDGSSLPAPSKRVLKDALETKLLDFQKALNAVLGIEFIARSEDVTGTPGEKEDITLYFYNRGIESVNLKGIKLLAPGTIAPANGNKPFGEQPPGSAAVYRYSIDINRDARAMEPFWYTDNNRDARYKTRPTEDEFAPFSKPAIRAEAAYLFKGVEVPIHGIAKGQAGDPIRGADFVEFQIVPELSVTLQPDFEIVPDRAISNAHKFRVSILSNRKGEIHGTLKLVSETGWKIQPSESEFTLSRKGETSTASFVVQVPAASKAGDYSIEAIAALNGREFKRGYQVVSYPENWTRNFYAPARSRIERFDVKIAPKLTVGYISGAGDDIPAALEQLGIKVQMLSGSDLAFSDLGRFSAIVTGIRAYNVNEDLRANNRRLLNYVKQGGILIVQYVRPTGRPARGSTGSPFLFGPYPMSVSDADRITVEDSPVKILDPANPLFNRPNKITEADFRGWVQERGLYFMNTWDSQYEALISGNDPGEEPKNGGMLYARYGKGYYIYTGYSWFRQLPAGVPGAFRIFANMLSLGRP